MSVRLRLTLIYAALLAGALLMLAVVLRALLVRALQVSLRARNAGEQSLRETLRVVYAEAQRMKRLVDDLMTLARADIGEQPLQRAPLSLDDLLKEVCEAAQWMMGNRRLELQADEEVTVVADADRLKQLTMNLLDNAAKHTLPDGIVLVRLHRQNEHAVVTVSDNGEGIPPEHLLLDRPSARRDTYRLQRDGARDDVHPHSPSVPSILKMRTSADALLPHWWECRLRGSAIAVPLLVDCLKSNLR